MGAKKVTEVGMHYRDLDGNTYVVCRYDRKAGTVYRGTVTKFQSGEVLPLKELKFCECCADAELEMLDYMKRREKHGGMV